MLYLGAEPNQCMAFGFYLFLRPLQASVDEIRAFGPFESPMQALKYHDRERIPDEEIPSVFLNRPPTVYGFRDGPLRYMTPLLLEERTGLPGLFNHGIQHLQPIRTHMWSGCHGHPSFQETNRTYTRSIA